MATNAVVVVVVVVVVGGSCYQVFKVLKLFFISQSIVIKLRLQIGDNIRDFCTVLDSKVKS